MARSRFLSFFPSILIGLVLLAAIYLAEKQHDKVLRQEEAERISNQIDEVRARFEHLLDDDVQLAHELAGKLGPLAGLTQSGFDVYVETTFGNRPEVVLAELAPDMVTKFVHPLDGNQDRLGLDLREAPGDDAALRVRSTRSAVMYGPIRRPDGREVLVVRIPVLSHSATTISFVGVLSVLLDIDEMLRLSGIPDPEGDTQFAIMYEDDAGALEGLVFGSREILSGAPATTEIAFPQGSWTILAVPENGWERSIGERAPYLLRLFLLGALILIPAALANWYAVSRRRMIAKLEATEARLTGVLQNMPGAVFVYTMPKGRDLPGPDDQIEFFDKQASEEIWGLPADKVEKDAMVLWEHAPRKERHESFAAEISASSRQLRPWHYTWPIETPDGTQKWLEGRGHPTRLPDGATRWFCLVVDASDEIEKAESLKQQQALANLAQKNDSIGKLTGGVAHDFNNLLAVVMGNQELLREALETDAETNAELLEFVDSSLQATARGADLTRKMLSFARKARLEPAVLDVNNIVREINAWAGRTMPETIKLSFSLDEGLPPVRVDKGSAESALLNLMVNARDAMEGGGTLSIATQLVSLDATAAICRDGVVKPGKYVLLEMRDNGKGISPEVLPKVFDPFFTTKPPASGSGLGLSMVKGFMEQSGGAVCISSTPGKGTLVQLYFEALDQAAPAVAKPVPTSHANRRSGARILLAEDEVDVRNVLVSTLEKAGYNIVEAETGDEAFEMFKTSPDMDLLLTDIVMPGTLQGTDLAQAIRCMAPDLPVVFLSGYAAEHADPERSMEASDIRLSKPVARSELIGAIEASLGKGARLNGSNANAGAVE